MLRMLRPVLRLPGMPLQPRAPPRKHQQRQRASSRRMHMQKPPMSQQTAFRGSKRATNTPRHSLNSDSSSSNSNGTRTCSSNLKNTQQSYGIRCRACSNSCNIHSSSGTAWRPYYTAQHLHTPQVTVYTRPAL